MIGRLADHPIRAHHTQPTGGRALSHVPALRLRNAIMAYGTRVVVISEGLTELYGAPVDVVRAQGRVIVVPSVEGSVVHQRHPDELGAAADRRAG
jgi:hypothetical protein